MLINYKCAFCNSNEYCDDAKLKNENYMQEYYDCKCSKCKEINVVMCWKPLRQTFDLPPFKLN